MTGLRLLAIDLARAATGIAGTHNHRGGPQLFARTVHTRRTVPAGIDHRRIDACLVDVHAALKCDPHLVVIEWQPQYDGHGDESLRLAELHGVLKHCMLYRRGIRYVEVMPTHLQMYATGKGRALKEVVQAAAIARWGRWVHIGDHNAADAVTLLAMALDAYGQPLASLPDKHRRAVRAVDWPNLDDAPTDNHRPAMAGPSTRETQ